MKPVSSREAGQATIEYLFVLLLLMFLGIQMLKFTGDYLGNHIGSLAYVLSHQLATGVCKTSCMGDEFTNKLWP